MKSFFALTAGLLLSLSAFAVQSGEYHCASKDNKIEVTYKIETVTVKGLSLTVMEVRHVTTDETGAKTYVIKGVANEFVNDKGEEMLMLGNNAIELVAGRPSCSIQ
jgi:hypothetical protein